MRKVKSVLSIDVHNQPGHAPAKKSAFKPQKPPNN